MATEELAQSQAEKPARARLGFLLRFVGISVVVLAVLTVTGLFSTSEVDAHIEAIEAAENCGWLRTVAMRAHGDRGIAGDWDEVVALIESRRAELDCSFELPPDGSLGLEL